MACNRAGARMKNSVGRRQILSGAGAALCVSVLPRCAANPGGGGQAALELQLAPLKATPDLITRITVCTRPFRAQGPRLDVEQIAGKTVVHNYGHGGSGWSLSWRSSVIAVKLAVLSGERDIALLCCGSIRLQ